MDVCRLSKYDDGERCVTLRAREKRAANGPDLLRNGGSKRLLNDKTPDRQGLFLCVM